MKIHDSDARSVRELRALLINDVAAGLLDAALIGAAQRAERYESLLRLPLALVNAQAAQHGTTKSPGTH